MNFKIDVFECLDGGFLVSFGQLGYFELNGIQTFSSHGGSYS